MTTWLALLRGVNLGKYNKVPMSELRSRLSEAGFGNVRTYIQSGNVIVDSDETDPASVGATIRSVIEREFGVSTPAIMLTRDELAAAVDGNPFSGPDADPKAHRIMVLESAPSQERIDTLDPDRSPGHRFVVEGRIIWLDVPQWSQSKLSNDYFDRRLGLVSTMRNLSTCEVLLDMMDADS